MWNGMTWTEGNRGPTKDLPVKVQCKVCMRSGHSDPAGWVYVTDWGPCWPKIIPPLPAVGMSPLTPEIGDGGGLSRVQRQMPVCCRFLQPIRNSNQVTYSLFGPSVIGGFGELVIGHSTGSWIESGIGRLSYFDSTAANEDKVVAASEVAILLASIGAK